jgi:hypothetical protein
LVSVLKIRRVKVNFFKKIHTQTTYNLTGCAYGISGTRSSYLNHNMQEVLNKIAEVNTLMAKYRKMVNGFVLTDFVPKLVGTKIVLENMNE